MNEIVASIITIGDELLIGQTIDTNSAYIAQELNKIGIWVHRRVAVGDVYEDIWKTLDEESARSQLVIITGGLGPTADDITKPLLAKYFNSELVFNEAVYKHIEYLFTQVFRRPGALLERNKKQAEVPADCIVLFNNNGTAPGMWFEAPPGGGAIVVSLPGVPHEMKGLMQDAVIPRLQQTFDTPAILHKNAFTFGLGESMIAERLQEVEAQLPPHIKLAYLPAYGMVRLRLTARGRNKELLEKEIGHHFNTILALVQDVLISETDEPMEAITGRLLQLSGKTVATAESCTGGYIAHLITGIAGSSAWFKGSVVAYDNQVKMDLLNVQPATLETYGAVSEATVKEMVQGTLRHLKTDYALATSGIMGPGGGTTEKPVGTVWLAAGNAGKIITKKLQLRFDRERNIAMAGLQALNLLREFILETTS